MRGEKAALYIVDSYSAKTQNRFYIFLDQTIL
jgi:hypothetical protein